MARVEDSKPSEPSGGQRSLSQVASRARLLLLFPGLSSLAGFTFGACVPKDRPSTEESDAGGHKSAPTGKPDTARSTTRPAQKNAAPGKTPVGKTPAGKTPAGKTPAGDTAPDHEPSPALADENAAPRITRAFSADFSAGPLEPTWKATSPAWAIKEGRLCAENAKNHPVWLTHRLPTNARIEFTAESGDPDGDIKVELWGDGQSHATSTSYTNATSYLAIFGGWQNRYHVLARLDEHGKDRQETTLLPNSEDPRANRVVENQVYHFKIERRDGRTIKWYVDNIEIHTLVDDSPLEGPGHEHLGFNDWTVPVCFDDVVITPLDR